MIASNISDYRRFVCCQLFRVFELVSLSASLVIVKLVDSYERDDTLRSGAAPTATARGILTSHTFIFFTHLSYHTQFRLLLEVPHASPNIFSSNLDGLENYFREKWGKGLTLNPSVATPLAALKRISIAANQVCLIRSQRHIPRDCRYTVSHV